MDTKRQVFDRALASLYAILAEDPNMWQDDLNAINHCIQVLQKYRDEAKP